VEKNKTRVNEGEGMAAEDGAPENQTSSAANGTAQVADAPESLEALQAQAKEYLEGWQRARAEFANYKKRVERDMKDTYQNASGDALKSILPIIDDFDRALANMPEELKDNPWVSGVSMIQRKFAKLLEDFGVTLIDPTGQPFDPNLHQAIGTDDVEGVASGHVTKTEQKGYAIGDNVLRPALVRVNQ
jgi:molecular chaperone GrpE